MKLVCVLAFVCTLGLSVAYIDDSNEDITTKRFPENFLFGYASSAYQIEGGWDADGKGENIWDHDAHFFPERFPFNGTDGHNGDVACDSYHKYKEDVALLKEVGVGAYRFSISWARILPTGDINNINQAGIDYYRNLLNELKAANIVSLVTMHHWDTPQALEDLGGFQNESIVNYFVDFARLLFQEFGNDVKYWATFNEPKQICLGGYDVGGIAPQHLTPGIGGYICTHNLLKAHGKVYRIYDQEFRAQQNGLVSLVIDTAWYQSATDKPADLEAQERILQFIYGLYANPVVYGDYPEIMKTRIAQRSENEGFSSSRLPEFTDEEKEYLKGSYDYLTINMYTSYLVTDMAEPAYDNPAFWKDVSVYTYQPDEWETTVTSWFKVYPPGARRLVNWIKNTYGDEKGIIVTENGYHDNGEVLEDTDTRSWYYKRYLNNINKAINEDGVNVIGYMAWSLLNDIEWYAGHLVNVGMYHVDFLNDNRTRTAKESSRYYHKVVTTRCLEDVCDN